MNESNLGLKSGLLMALTDLGLSHSRYMRHGQYVFVATFVRIKTELFSIYLCCF